MSSSGQHVRRPGLTREVGSSRDLDRRIGSMGASEPKSTTLRPLAASTTRAAFGSCEAPKMDSVQDEGLHQLRLQNGGATT